MKNDAKQTNNAKRPYVSPEGAEIAKRFFLALDALKMQGKMHGILQFTKKHNINRWNLYTVKDNPERVALKPEYIYYMCKDYNVSLNWIFFGTGDFYDMSCLKTAYS